LLLNPLPVGVAEVGECEIGAIEKTESIVVILEIKTVSMAWRLLIDEAEGTTIGALPQTVKQSFGERQSKAIVSILLQLNAMQLTGTVTNLECQLLINDEIPVVDEITWTHTIDAEQLITRLESQLLAD
jgi:hypothetical protein